MLDNIKGKKLTEEDLDHVVGGANTDTPPYYLKAEVTTENGIYERTCSQTFPDRQSAAQGAIVFSRQIYNEFSTVCRTIDFTIKLTDSAGNITDTYGPQG